MADQKISELTALSAAPASDDYFVLLDTDASTTKKVAMSYVASATKVVNKMTSLAALADNAATSITPTNASGILFIRTLAGNGAVVAYDSISPTAYCFVSAGTSNVVATTGALSGTTGTDGKLTVSAHTDGKIYIENRLGSTAYIGYIAI